MRTDLRFCIIGRGSIGVRHVRNLKALSCDNIVAYSKTNNADKDNEFRLTYGIETFHELDNVREFDPDAFIIANPTAKHLEFAEMAIEMNSHVFMEKPLSNCLDGTTDLRKAIADRRLVFFMANNFRFHQALTRIKTLIQNNKFGNIYFARLMFGHYLPDWHPWEDYRQGYSARNDLGGGVVLTLQHEIDYAYWLFGKFKRIKSFVKKTSNLEINVEDIALMIIETESGQLLEIHIDCLQRPAKRTLQIQGSKGSIHYCFGDECLKFYDFTNQQYVNILDLTNYDNNQMYIDEMQHFIRCITKREKPESSLEDGVYILKTCIDIKKEFIL